MYVCVCVGVHYFILFFPFPFHYHYYYRHLFFYFAGVYPTTLLFLIKYLYVDLRPLEDPSSVCPSPIFIFVSFFFVFYLFGLIFSPTPHPPTITLFLFCLFFSLLSSICAISAFFFKTCLVSLKFIYKV